MPRKRELTWVPQRKCWSKYRNGKRYYLATGGVCKGKTDQEGYDFAIDEWRAIEAQLRAADYNGVTEVVRPRRIAQGQAFFLSNYAALGSSIGSPEVPHSGDFDIPSHVQHYLTIRRSESDAGEKSVETFAEHRQKLEDFLGFCVHRKAKQLDQIDESLLREYKQTQQQLKRLDKSKGGISPTTAKKRLSILRRFLLWAHENGYLDTLPRNADSLARDISLPPPRPAFYSPEECHKLFALASPRTKCYIALALNCGYTQSDIATLEHSMIDWKNGVIKRGRHKTSDENGDGPLQCHKLWTVTKRSLKAQATKTDSGLVLVNEHGGSLLTRTLKESGVMKRIDNITDAFSRLRKRASLPNDRSFKTFRKSGANEIEKLYPAVPHLSSLYLGHSETGVKRYYVDRPHHLLFEAIEQLENIYKLEDIK